MNDWGPLPKDYEYHGIALKYIDDRTCKFCGDVCLEVSDIEPHLHQGTWVCEECWDERLRTTA